MKVNESGSHDTSLGIDLLRGVYIFGADDDPVFHRDIAHGIQSTVRIKHAAAADQIIYFFSHGYLHMFIFARLFFELNVII